MDETVEETEVKDSEQATETETSDEEQASETKSSLRAEKEETKSSEAEAEEEEQSVSERDNKEDAFIDGFSVNEAKSGESYYFEIGKNIEDSNGGKITTQNTPIGDSYGKGLFSYKKGEKDKVATYHSEGYGCEFKLGNELTFKVAGNSYIVVGQDGNNDCTELLATSDTGTLSPTKNTTVGGHGSLDNCKARGANTAVYTYVGGPGSVTLTLNNGSKAYIAYVCIIPRNVTVQSWDFKDYPSDAPADWNGLAISNNKKDGNYLNPSSGTIKVPIKEINKAGKIIVKACYTYSFTIGDGKKVQRASKGATGNIDTFEYYYEAGTAEVVINISGASYINSIQVTTENLDITNTETWDFTKHEGSNNDAISNFNGLICNGKLNVASDSVKRLAISSGSVMVPVKKDCTIKVYPYYFWDFAFYDDNGDYIYKSDTSKTTPIEYGYTGGKGMVPIIVAKAATETSPNGQTSYIEKIEVVYNNNATVSGKVDMPDGLETVTLVFTNIKSGATKSVTVDSEGNYSINLPAGSAYTVSLENAPGYDIVNDLDKAFSIGEDETAKTLSLMISKSEKHTKIEHFTLEAEQYSQQAADVHNAGQSLKGKPDEFFTIYMNQDFEIDGTDVKKFTPDSSSYFPAYSGQNRLKFSSNTTASKSGEIEFTIEGHSVLWVYWMTSNTKPYLAIRDENGKIVTGENGKLCAEKVEDTSKQNVSSFTITEAGTYYISSATEESENSGYGNGNYIYKALIATPVEVEPDYVEGKTIDFSELKGINAGDVPSIKGITFDKITWHDSQHGLEATKGSTMELSLSNEADITVETCQHGVGDKATMSANGVNIEGETIPNADPRKQFTLKNVEKGDLLLEFGSSSTGSQIFIHSITIKYNIKLPPREKIDVWDFGGKLETDTADFAYTNNITIDKLTDANIINAGKFSANGNTAFGDLTVTYKQNDVLYSSDAALSGTYTPDSKTYAKVKYEENGYESDGGYYCNGYGDASSRHVTIANVRAGEKIVAYMGLSQNGPETFHFTGLGTASKQDNTVVIDKASFAKCEFIAEYDGSYKIWEEPKHDKDSGKPMYHRIMRIPGVAVSGSIDTATNSCTLPEDYTVKFINQTTDVETEAEVKEDGSFTVTLAPGYEYRAVLSGAKGFGFTNDSKKVKTEDKEYKTGKQNVTLVVETKATCTYNGSITGFAEDYPRISKAKITLMPLGDSDKIVLDIQDDLTFMETLLQGEKYTIELSGVDDYEVKSSPTVNAESDVTDAEIQVGLKTKYSVTGGFIDVESEKLTTLGVTKLTFTIIEDGRENKDYDYEATIANNGYSVELRDGAYIANATVTDTNYSTTTHVVVKGGAVTKDLMFVVSEDTSALARVADLYVGYPDKGDDNYATVNKAVKAAKRMNPKSEEERITIHIAPGTYTEQIIVETPYISFVNDTDEKVLLTWYYGIGYTYYSANDSGYYDPVRAYDRYEKKGVARWGVGVYIKEKATAFRAEGITFENSFNYRVTGAEMTDGVEANTKAYSDTKITLERKAGVDVQSNAATERAAALAVEADLAEFKNCGFYSSQDTLYIGNGEGDRYVHVYFKDCVIEGETDYIFGYGDCVFDDCELSWKGYSADAKEGYITATRFQFDNNGKISNEKKGYLFRDCIITGNKDLTVKEGYFGRPWGSKATVVFMNTVLESADLITAAGWSKMNNDKPEDANYREYNTTFADQPVVTSGRVTGTVMTDEQAAAINVTDYFGTWTPEYYVEKQNNDERKKADVTADPAPTEEGVASGINITLTAVPADAEIYYTLDGTSPKVNSDRIAYDKEAGIVLNYSDTKDGKITILAYAKAAGDYKDSDVKTFEYTVIRDSSGDDDPDNPDNPNPPAGQEAHFEKVLNVSEDLDDGDITENKIIKETFTVTATAENKVVVDTPTSQKKYEADGLTSLTKRLKLSGAGTAEYRSIKFTVPETVTEAGGKLSVYAFSASSSALDRSITLYKADGTEVFKGTALAASGATVTKNVYEFKDPGEYYIASGEEVNVYYVKLEYSYMGTPAPGDGDDDDDDDPDDGSVKATIWVVGDSTVSGFSDTYYIPRQGYGEQIKKYFNADVYNLAHSGASSKDFLGMTEYKTLINGSDAVPKLGTAETEGKFLIIGFGHNDEKTEEARYTNPNSDYKTPGSFANSLYENYIKKALDAGVTPVVVTPIVRLTDENTAESYNGSSGHITKTTTVSGVTYEGGDYAKAIRDMCAADELKDKVILVDLTAETLALNVKLGDGAKWMHAFTAGQYKDDSKTEIVPTESSVDKTHTNSYGAKMNAWLIGDLTKETALGKHRRDKKQPSYDEDFKAAVNSSYVPTDYTAPTEEEMAGSGWPVYTDASGRKWYGTAFGDTGGQDKITANKDGTGGIITENFNAVIGDDNSLTLSVKNNAGKFAGTTDGFIFYYTRLKAGSVFTLDAKAKVNHFEANNQVSYGLMARDEVYINKYVSATMGDFVAAGTLNQGAYNGFGRKNTERFNGPKNITNSYMKDGDSPALKISGTADGFSLNYGENPAVSAGFDYPLTGVDTEYIYVGFFVGRNADITFSDISLTVEGEENPPTQPDDPTPDDPTPDDPTPGPGEDDPLNPADPDRPKTDIDIADTTVITVKVPNVLSNGKPGRQDSEPVVTWTHEEDGKTVNRKLVEGYHYTVEDKAGSDYTTTDTLQTYVIKGIKEAGFIGQTEASYKIYDKNSSEVKLAGKLKVTLGTKKFDYTGAAITFDDITVSDGKTTLEKGKDYDIVFKNNYNSGKGTVIVVGLNNEPNASTNVSYIGSKEVDFTINKADISKAEVTFDDAKEYKYLGSAVTVNNLKVTLKTENNTYTLRKGADYTVVYKANDKPGTANFTIKAMGDNFKGSVKKTFTIGDLKLEDIRKDENALKTIEYSPKGAKLSTIEFKLDGNSVTLKEGRDYKVKYTGDTKTVGSEVTAKITGKNVDRNATLDATLTVVAADFGRVSVASEADLMIDAKKWSSKDKQVKVTDYAGAKLKLGTDYELVWDAADTGSAATGLKLTVKPSNAERYTGEKTVGYRVAGKLGKGYTVKDKYFNGRTPVTVTADDIEGLDAGDFRIVSYKNNAKAGKAGKPVKASVTIEGTGKYYGKITLKFDVYN